jgi:hypothetical protein
MVFRLMADPLELFVPPLYFFVLLAFFSFGLFFAVWFVEIQVVGLLTGSWPNGHERFTAEEERRAISKETVLSSGSRDKQRQCDSAAPQSRTMERALPVCEGLVEGLFVSSCITKAQANQLALSLTGVVSESSAFLVMSVLILCFNVTVRLLFALFAPRLYVTISVLHLEGWLCWLYYAFAAFTYYLVARAELIYAPSIAVRLLLAMTPYSIASAMLYMYPGPLASCSLFDVVRGTATLPVAPVIFLFGVVTAACPVLVAFAFSKSALQPDHARFFTFCFQVRIAGIFSRAADSTRVFVLSVHYLLRLICRRW